MGKYSLVACTLFLGIFITSPLSAKEKSTSELYMMRNLNGLYIKQLWSPELQTNEKAFIKSITQLFKQTDYPIRENEKLQVDLYVKDIFKEKYRLARLIKKAKKPFMTSKIVLNKKNIKNYLLKKKSGPIVQVNRKK